MISGLKPYPVMKDSGVPWLGKVPEHWRSRRLRQVLTRVTLRNRPDLPLLSVVREKGVILRDTTNRAENRNFIPDDLSNYKVVWTGQFAINKMKAWQGSYGVSRHSGIVSPAYFVFDVNGVDAEFFHTAIRSRAYVPFFVQASDGVRIGQWDLAEARMKQIPFFVPPSDEQAAIVRFLDHYDRKIRRYIRAKQKLIKLLEEQKQIIIHNAVTRGLDPNVRLKPSGVEWLGDLPENWEAAQLRRLIVFLTSGSRAWASFYSDTGDIFLQSGNLGRAMALNLSQIQHVRPPIGSEGQRTRIQLNDILICITGALTGNVVHIDTEPPGSAFVNQHVALVRPNTRLVFPRYLAYALHSETGRVQFKTVEYGGTKQGLGLEGVKSTFVPLPPLSEQIKICSYLDGKIDRFHKIADQIKQEMSLLREFGTRLITDVVTGKLDVQKAVAQLPNEAEEEELLDELENLADSDETSEDVDEDNTPVEPEE